MPTSFVAASTATSGTFNSPSGTRVGDQLLLMETAESSTAPTLKSGWTNIGTGTVLTGIMAFRMSQKIATGSDSFTLTGNNAVMLSHRGGILDIFTVTASGDPLSGVTTSGLRWIVVFAALVNANPSDNSGYTNRANSLTSIYRIKVWDTNGKKVAGSYNYDLSATGSGAGGVVIAVKDEPFVGWGVPIL